MRYSVSISSSTHTFALSPYLYYYVGARMYTPMKEADKNGLIYFSSILFGKWKLLILYELIESPKRFKEIQDSLGNISAKVLTETIQDLMTEGLIIRISYPEVPPRVNYYLSQNGKRLIPLIREMLAWGMAHQKYRSK